MPQIPVSVVVDFTGVTYNNGVWTGTPSWTIPSNVSVHNGQNTITWTLTANNVSSGYSAGFPSASAIVFKSTNNPPWSGGTPTTQSATSVTASDNFQGLASAVKFYYTTNVVLTTAASISNTFTYDPDIENEPGG